jgi:hypothetical protein
MNALTPEPNTDEARTPMSGALPPTLGKGEGRASLAMPQSTIIVGTGCRLEVEGPSLHLCRRAAQSTVRP